MTCFFYVPLRRPMLVCALLLTTVGCYFDGGDKDEGSESGDLDGSDGGGIVDADLDGDGFDEEDDCDDQDEDINPGADELCNGIDDNCDGLVDEHGAVDAPGWYYDADGDGYGVLDDVTYACEQPPAHSDDPRDCDDTRDVINPGAAEVCDDIDNDCDGLVDDDDDSLEGDAADWFVDGDGDGHGDPDTVVIACTQPDGTVASGGDCNDSNPSIHPDRDEVCDGIDNDCSGAVDDDPVDDGDLYYPDADGDGYGDPDRAARACTPPAGWISRGGDCDDTTGQANPGRTEVCDDGLDNDCDGTGLGCLLEGDLLVSADYDLRLVGEGNFDYAGGAVALMPDVSGDGVPDLAIGASGDDEGGTTAGAIYLVRANRVGARYLSAADGKILGLSAGDQVGLAVVGLGDANGDGVGDLLVGARYANRGSEDSGGAWLVTGPVTGTVSLSDATLTLAGESRIDYAGGAVAQGGDTNNDGVVELLIGAYGNDEGGVGAGAAYLVAADNTGGASLNAAQTKFIGEAAGDLAGDAVSGGADTDGDGYDDVLIGARQADAGGANSGAAYLVLGPVSGDVDLADADLILAGEASNDAAGTSVLLAGDLTGDGLPDVVVGATGNDSAGTGAGVAYVIAGGTTGSMSLGSADARLNGRSAGENLGGSACDGGDVNGDGDDDLLVGAEGHNSGRGALYVYTGPLAGTVAGVDATARIRGHATGDRAGVCGGAQDVNRDGFDEVAVGADGNDIAGNYAGAAWLLRPAGL